MKIQYASDLHLEFKSNTFWIAENFLKPTGEILILNGDITLLRDGFEKDYFFDYISDNFKQTYIIPGNHEFYAGYDMKDSLSLDIDIRPNVKLFNNQSIIIDTTKIIFTTLWTSIKDNLVEDYLNDFHKSKYKGERLNYENYNILYQQCVEFLEGELKNNSSDNTIVVSHHIPTEKANAYKGGSPIINQAFVVNLDPILEAYKIDY
jgi:DNA repair exonuclease SbcCD nuclease subunit